MTPRYRPATSSNASIDPPGLNSRSHFAASSVGTARAGATGPAKLAIATRTRSRTRSHPRRITQLTCPRAFGWPRTLPRGPHWRSRATTTFSKAARSSSTSTWTTISPRRDYLGTTPSKVSSITRVSLKAIFLWMEEAKDRSPNVLGFCETQNIGTNHVKTMYLINNNWKRMRWRETRNVRKNLYDLDHIVICNYFYGNSLVLNSRNFLCFKCPFIGYVTCNS